MPKVFNGNLDALKVVLAICVVALHCKILGGNDTAIGYMLGNGLFRVASSVTLNSDFIHISRIGANYLK